MYTAVRRTFQGTAGHKRNEKPAKQKVREQTGSLKLRKQDKKLAGRQGQTDTETRRQIAVVSSPALSEQK